MRKQVIIRGYEPEDFELVKSIRKVRERISDVAPEIALQEDFNYFNNLFYSYDIPQYFTNNKFEVSDGFLKIYVDVPELYANRSGVMFLDTDYYLPYRSDRKVLFLKKFILKDVNFNDFGYRFIFYHFDYSAGAIRYKFSIKIKKTSTFNLGLTLDSYNPSTGDWSELDTFPGILQENVEYTLLIKRLNAILDIYLNNQKLATYYLLSIENLNLNYRLMTTAHDYYTNPTGSFKIFINNIYILK
ncbi:MAG: hypothetical protein QXX78_06895 [Nitrososphaerota archaeon]